MAFFTGDAIRTFSFGQVAGAYRMCPVSTAVVTANGVSLLVLGAVNHAPTAFSWNSGYRGTRPKWSQCMMNASHKTTSLWNGPRFGSLPRAHLVQDNVTAGIWIWLEPKIAKQKPPNSCPSSNHGHGRLMVVICSYGPRDPRPVPTCLWPLGLFYALFTSILMLF